MLLVSGPSCAYLKPIYLVNRAQAKLIVKIKKMTSRSNI